MKNTSTNNNCSVFQDAVSPLTETPLEEDDILMPSGDILAKFTGYELDRGKLRYQLCQWLKKEVVALQRCCSYKPCLLELAQGMAGPGREEAQAQPGEVQHTRRYWLQSNQPLLPMFLSYCSLHGSHGEAWPLCTWSSSCYCRSPNRYSTHNVCCNSYT